MLQRLLTNRFSIIPAIAFSSILYLLSTGLQGQYWLWLWFAPIPILVYSYFHSKAATFCSAFLACLLSKLNIVCYFLEVLPPVLALTLIIFSSLLFAGVILVNKVLVSNVKPSLGILIFPLLTTALEFILSLMLPDGTFGSIAYTQANNINLIQIASITGIYGITFTVSLFASLLTYLLLTKSTETSYSPLILPSLILIAILGFGYFRISHSTDIIQNGLCFSGCCIKVDSLPSHANINKEKNRAMVLQRYEAIINRCHFRTLGCIVLPEKIAALRQSEKGAYYKLFSNIAAQKNALIVVGWTIKGNSAQNIATVFFPSGKYLEYQKKYLVSGWEKTFSRGEHVLSFDYRGRKVAVAICKDMDFPGWIRKYSDVDILMVPAWDFRTDHWLHSRMAILRGVENGFTLIRSAKEGNLTLSDPYGRIIKESVFDNGKPEVILTSTFRLVRLKTVYSQFGDWFGWLNVWAVIVFSLSAHFSLGAIKSPKNRQNGC